MKLHLRSCLLVIVLSVHIEAQANENETDSNEGRRGRVYGRIVKLYSGIKPDPILCSEEGFKADPADCSTFYRCVQSFGGKYNVFKFQCGPGTVYDPATEVCNHPSNTKRSECRGPIVPIQQEIHDIENDIDFRELPSPISTITPNLNTKINASESFTTATGLADKYTDIRNSTTNYNTLTTTANQQFSEAFGYLGSSWSNKYTTSSQGPSSSTDPSRSDKSDPCTYDGFIGDSYNCKKFYRCVNNFRGGFIRYEFTCGESTVWDEDKQSCNYAWDVRSTRCGKDPYSDNNLPMSVEKDKPELTSNYHYATTQNQNENIATKNPNSINFGDKLNNYYNSMTSESPVNNINNNKPQITNSNNNAPTYHYNENIVTEKHPIANHFTENQYNNYNPQIMENQINYGVTEGHNQVEEIKKDITHTTSTEHAPSSTRKSDSNKMFNNMCLESGFIGDPNDCHKFYRCVDSGKGSFTRYDFSCSQGTVWDSSIEACNHAWAVKGCGSKMATQGLMTESNAVIPSSSMSINEGQDNEDEDTDDDYGYLNQINQEHTKTTTSAVETTSYQPLSTTSEGRRFDKSCSASGFFKNSEDCKKFYKCIENGRGSFTRFDYNCGEGTVWDETIEACNHDWAVKSCKSSPERQNDVSVMTTVTLVQTTTQKNINTEDYDSIYGLEQSMSTPDTARDETPSTTSEGTLNSNNRQCNRNGFMGDKEDCNKFYRCVENGHNGYIRYEFSCGDGTVWDPTIEACNHARDVEDCRSSSSNNIDGNNQEPIDSNEDVDNGYVTPSHKDPDNSVQSTIVYTTTPISETDSNNNICKSPGFIGDTESCEKFYRCVDNGNGGFSRIEFSCGEGTVWDSSIEACNHRWAVEKCGKGANNEVSETTTHSSVATSTNAMSDTTTKASEESHTTTQQQQNHSDNKCTSEGFFGMKSEDCKKFYRCVDDGKGGYTKYDFSCGDGTIWDESIQACNHATNDVTCDKGTPSSKNSPRPDSTSILSTNSMTPTTPITTVNTNAPTYDDKCTSEGFISDSSDCRKFYRCVDNGKGGLTKFEFSCGEGTVWVQEIQACDHDTDETNCNVSKSTTMKISTTVAEEFITSSTQGSTDNIVTTTTSSTTESNYVNKTDSDKCSSEGFYSNKNDCTRFYRCVDDGKGSYTKYEFTCAEGTAWDVHSQSCNYISEVSSCQNNKIPQTETKPDPGDSSESEIQENTTTTKPQSTTMSSHPRESKCEEEGFFGDTEDCKKFYRCVSNEKEGFTKYDFSCGDGTIWDKDITACNHPQDVSNPSCKSDGSSSPSSSTSTTTHVSNGITSAPVTTSSPSTTSAPVTTSSPSTTSAPVTTSSSSTTSAPATTSSPSTTSTIGDVSSTTAKDTNSNCSDSNKNNANNGNYTCTKAGFYADPNDCKKFYRCVDWENNGEKFSIFHFDCGDGTIWDPALETCNYEESVYPPRNCNGSQQQNQNKNETSSTTDISSGTESTTSTYETTSTSIQPSTAETEPTTTTTQKSTTQSKPTTTTQKSTTQTSTTQSKPPATTTTTTTTSTQKSTTQESTTTTSTTTEPSTQQTSTTSREESTTDSSTQSTTETTIASNTDQTTTNKEPTTSEATTEQPTTTTEVTTTTEEISPQTTDSQSSTTDSTTTTSAQESTTEGNSSSTSSNKDCPDTEDDQYLYVCPTSFKRHPKYCNMFYQCTDDDDNHEVKVAVFNCPNNTIYDESKTQCVEENKADKKCNGQISQRNRIKRLGASNNEPVVVSRDSMACPSAGHFPFEKQEKCSPALLKCEYSRSGKLKGYVYKCPEGFVYWTISRRCEAIRKIRECKRSSYPWNKRYDIPVERRNISL